MWAHVPCACAHMCNARIRSGPAPLEGGVERHGSDLLPAAALAADPQRLTAVPLASVAVPRERILLRQPLLRHQQALGTLDRLPRREGVGERLRLLPQALQLLVPRPRRLDGRQQVLLAEGLDEIAEHAGLDRARDELVL